jgi:CHAD domain-containing protein
LSNAARLSALVAKEVNEAFADVVRRRQAIDPAHASTVHRTRIAFKKFRYMVESLSPGLTGLGKSDLRALARYQKRMGILQDLEVMQECIKGFAEHNDGMAGLLTTFNSYLQGRRARALRGFLNSADELFRFWPPHAAHANGSSPVPGITPLSEPLVKSPQAAAPPAARVGAMGAS